MTTPIAESLCHRAVLVFAFGHHALQIVIDAWAPMELKISILVSRRSFYDFVPEVLVFGSQNDPAPNV